MSTLTYRKVVSAKDIALVARLAQGIWREHYETMFGTGQTAYMLSLFQSESAISRQILSGEVYKLCISDGQTVGYYSIWQKDGAMHIGRIYLKKEERGKGYAHQILGDILSQCADCTEIRLAINKANVPSIAAYRSLGFEVCGERTTDIGAGYLVHDYLMRLPLQTVTAAGQPQHSA